MNYQRRQSKLMNDEQDPDSHLLRALHKKRLKDHVSYEQILEGENRFYRLCRLAKGKQGDVMNNAEYYWSAFEDVTHHPAPHRFPIYRTKIPRKQVKGTFKYGNSH